MRAALSLMMILGLSCSQEYQVEKKVPQNTAAPVLRVDPVVLTLPAAAKGSTSTAVFSVRNDGNATMILQDLVWQGSGAFAVLEDAIGSELAPAASMDLTVVYSPETPLDTATVVVVANDPKTPEVPVSLSGSMLAGQLALDPDYLDLGNALPGCTRQGTLGLANVGEAPVEVHNFLQSSSAFALAGVPSLPFTLAPDESLVFDVDFDVANLGAYDSTVLIESDEPAGTRVGYIHADLVELSEGEEEFVQPSGPHTKVDFLFTIDQSGSMLEEIAGIREQSALFMDTLHDLEADARVAVVTEDNGCANDKIINADDVNAAYEMQDALNGGSGYWTEAGMRLAIEALENTGGGCNNGFGRDDALVAVVHVSDEPDQSDCTWDDCIADMEQHADALLINAVAGPYPDGCETAAAGEGYYQAVLATGGTYLNICDSEWDVFVVKLVQNALEAPRRNFTLDGDPDPDTIEVRVNEVVDDRWEWDAQANAVVFLQEAMPPKGGVISVTYATAVECD